MILLLANVAAIAIVGLLVLRRGRDRQAGGSRAAQWLRTAGLIAMGLQIAVYLLFGLGEVAGGESGGAMHLVQASVIAVLGILAWMRPLEGGIALFACAALSAIGSLAALIGSGPLPQGGAISPALIITALPQMVAGVLFFAGGRPARRDGGV